MKNEIKKNTEELFELIKTGIYDAEKAIELIKKGIDHTFTNQGWNMLQLAVQDGGNVEVVKLLIEAGVDVMAVTNQGWNILEFYKNPMRVMTSTFNDDVFLVLKENFIK